MIKVSWWKLATSISQRYRIGTIPSRFGMGESGYLIRHGWELHQCRSRIPRACESAKRRDSTLEEILSAMAKQGIRGSRSACQRFFQRHNVSFKKAYTWQSKSEPIARARRRGYESRAA